MQHKTVEIAGDNRHICKEHGFLSVFIKGERLGRLPLDDLGAVLAVGHGITWSNDLLAALAERCVPVLICGRTMRPVALFWSLEGHHLQAERIRQQASASAPVAKRAWQTIIQAKIRHQAEVAALRGLEGEELLAFARRVGSGDSGNMEGIAARHYWRLCFGPEFRRDPDQPGVNGLLNYGYAILRAATARAVMLAGLHPAFGLHHKNAKNPMPLVDDLMEVLRPAIDLLVLELRDAGVDEVTREAKERLVTLPDMDIRLRGEVSTVATSLHALAGSLAEVFGGERRSLVLPDGLESVSDGASPCNA